MSYSNIRTFGYLIGGIWTAWGGRKRIEAKQLKNLRRLIRRARNKSPYFHKLYTHLPRTILIKLDDLPVTTKVDLMGEFDNWLTDRSLTLLDSTAKCNSTHRDMKVSYDSHCTTFILGGIEKHIWHFIRSSPVSNDTRYTHC